MPAWPFTAGALYYEAVGAALLRFLTAASCGHAHAMEMRLKTGRNLNINEDARAALAGRA